jgi:hypothetical protein
MLIPFHHPWCHTSCKALCSLKPRPCFFAQAGSYPFSTDCKRLQTRLVRSFLLLKTNTSILIMPSTRSDVSGDSAKHATVTMTFRIAENIMDVLRLESEKREISINTLVNQILKRYTEWDMYEPKLGMIPIARPLVSALFERLDEEDITDIARKIGKNVVHDIALFMKSAMDLPSFMSWFETRIKTSSIEFSHNRLANGRHTYVIKHDLGYNWSLYHKTIFELIFNEMLQTRIDIAITPTTMTMAFDE